MIIASSSIGMESARSYTSVRMDAMSLRKSGGINSFLTSLRDANTPADEETENEKEKVSTDLKNSLEDIKNRYDALKTSSTSSASKLERDAMTRIKTQCLQYLLFWLFGKTSSYSDTDFSFANEGISTGSTGNVSQITETFTNIHYFSESEETTFSTTGKVITASGKEIDFDLSLSMSRSFTEYYEENYESSYALCDPLVINLGTDIASVSDQKFMFDIDADGELDEVSRLSSNCGYLAIDYNNDGIINDGSELFGTKSGNGFLDLSAYDLDGNGWIDEADEIWKSLKIYIQNDDGSESLYSLAQKGVGAIYLGNVSTNYSINDTLSNQTNAVIRNTGIFLYENGNVGTVQHVDLAKAEYSA